MHRRHRSAAARTVCFGYGTAQWDRPPSCLGGDPAQIPSPQARSLPAVRKSNNSLTGSRRAALICSNISKLGELMPRSIRLSTPMPPLIPRARPGPFLQPRQQPCQRHAKAPGDLHQIREAQIGLPALNRSHERPMHAAMIGKALLRVALLHPKLPYSPAQRLEDFFHSQESEGVSAARLQRVRRHCLHRVL